MKSFSTFYQQSRWPRTAHSFTILSTSQVFAPGRCLLFVLSAPPMWHHLKHGFVQVLEPDFKLTPLLFYCWAALDSNLISHFIHASICIYWPPRASDKHRANKGFWASAVRILGNGAYLGMRAYIRQWRGGYSNCTPSAITRAHFFTLFNCTELTTASFERKLQMLSQIQRMQIRILQRLWIQMDKG